MKISFTRAIISTLILLIITFLFFKTSFAQLQDPAWSQPYMLSSLDSNANPGTLIADHYGYIHAFWPQTALIENQPTIMYARFDGENWTVPIDIHIGGSGYKINNLQSTISDTGLIYLVWPLTQNGPLNFINAPAYYANDVRSWSEPVQIDVPANNVFLLGNEDQTLTMIYSVISSDQPGVYSVQSIDDGQTWSSPIPLDTSIQFGFVPQTISIFAGMDGAVHAVWWLVDLYDTSRPGSAIRYSKSVDGGGTWSSPVIIAQSTADPASLLNFASPSIAASNNDVIIIWAGGERPYRMYAVSYDNGNTWSLPARVLPLGSLHGQAGGDGIGVDSAGRVHLFSQIRYPQGLYHIYWDQSHWSNPSLVYLIANNADDPKGQRIHVHSIQAAIRLGNQLILTFTNSTSDPQRYLFTIKHTLQDLASIPSLPTSTIQFDSPSLISTGTPSELSRVQPTSIQNITGTVSTSTLNSPLSPVVISLIPVLILLGGIFIYKNLNKR